MKFYICAPFRSDTIHGVRENVSRADRLAKWVASQGYDVICTHVEGLETVDNDGVETDRELALKKCEALVRTVDVVYVVSDVITEGMDRELKAAEGILKIFMPWPEWLWFLEK